jgi:hypothetical protein
VQQQKRAVCHIMLLLEHCTAMYWQQQARTYAACCISHQQRQVLQKSWSSHSYKQQCFEHQNHRRSSLLESMCIGLVANSSCEASLPVNNGELNKFMFDLLLLMQVQLDKQSSTCRPLTHLHFLWCHQPCSMPHCTSTDTAGFFCGAISLAAS